MIPMTEQQVTPAPTTDRDWWRGAVIYQIYPRSYQDSNHDGVGDLAGIIHRLQHVASLGVDAIWIAPFFRSPMKDFGYDVSDYRDVDPLFGSIGDFDALIRRAHEMGLKVLIDLVISHTSDQHPWFRESRASRDNPKADWYVWGEPKPDGTPPNNWLSMFGGPAWQWDGERMQYYLHNFLREQPDLNFHNAEVQDEILATARYWLDRGVDGFRLDTINFYFHNDELTSNPPLAAELRTDKIAPAVNPYNWQDHLHDKSRDENLDFLKRLRAVMDEYPAATSLGEVGDDQRGLELQAAYTADGDKVHMCYGFDFLSPVPPTGRRFHDVISRYEEAGPDSWACWAFSNHDVVRHASRWNLSEPALRLYAGLLLTLRGSVCLYQGEELGLTEAYVAFEDLQDPYGKEFWPRFRGRDGCRTPLPWVQDNANGGFTDAKPWLPVAVEHLDRAVGRQEGDEGSTLAFYRAMLAFRKANPAMAKGSLSIVESRDDFLSLIREHEGVRLFAAFNLSAMPMPVSVPPGDWSQDRRAPFKATVSQRGVTLPPWQAYFARSQAEG